MESNCERCGVDLPVGTHKFCPECGYKFPVPVTVAPAARKAATPPPAPAPQPARAKKSPIIVFGGGFLGLVFLLVLCGLFFGGGLEDIQKQQRDQINKQAAIEMQNINNQVVADAVAQYEIAKRQGDKLQIAVQAGFVCAAYLQAKDEENYRKWKAIEEQVKKEAGL